MELSVETLSDDGDDALAETILHAWSDDLGDLMIANPRPEGYHQGKDDDGNDDDNWWPHGYAGYGFLFAKGKLYVAVLIPKRLLPLVASNPDARGRYEKKIRAAWKKTEEKP
jgi:hypothetical protein